MTKILVAVVMILSVLAVPQFSFAGTTEVDALIEKLVEKGVLTRAEAIAIKGEIAADAKIFREEEFKESLPGWVQNLKLKGDFRLRFQKERRADDTEPRKRGRIRYRLGVEAKVTEQVRVGAGLATGSDDPRSTNQTLEDSFETPDIRLDYAFVEYEPTESITLVGGKFPRKAYLWQATDMLWDGDINPNGGSVHLDRKLFEVITGFINSGLWIITENGKSDRTDPFLFFGQFGFKYKDKNSPVDFTAAGVKYGFNGLKGTSPDFSAGTNTTGGGVLLKDYDALGADFEVGLASPFGLSNIERVAIFGNLIKNLDFGTDRFGYAGGIKFGNEKVNGKGKWQFKYQYAWLEKDAWPDFLPDSDRLGGATNVKGHEWILDYGVAKNVILGFDAYITDAIMGTKNPETIFQGDLVVKF